EDDTLDLLATHAAGVKVILHCFSMADRLDECLARGYWISFAGNVTFPKAPELRAAAARVPADRLLVGTDSPFLAPHPVPGHPPPPPGSPRRGPPRAPAGSPPRPLRRRAGPTPPRSWGGPPGPSRSSRACAGCARSASRPTASSARTSSSTPTCSA